GLLAYGLFRFATETLPHYVAPPEWSLQETIEPLGLLLVLRAFASGSVALTGVEAVSNGVPAFKRPEPRNAQVALILMGSFFGGDRLAFTTGIVVLALLSTLLIVAFSGSVTNLIPLYTVGVFVAFTLSQAGMVRHWWKLRGTERGWRWRAALNGLGAAATAIVALVVGAAKFALGAWMVLVLIPALIGLLW